MSDQIHQRQTWIAHWNACHWCRTRAYLCPAGAGLAIAVLNGMLPDESLLTPLGGRP